MNLPLEEGAGTSSIDDGPGNQVGTITGNYDWISLDCNGNGIADEDDVANGTSQDCNANGVPDECDIASGLDCNGNGIPDSCDIASGFALDCNNNGIPDDCDITNDPTVDVNLNSVPDSCEVTGSRYWILSPVTGNWYAVTDQLEADDAAQMAVNLGGDLVTINSQAENDWLSDQFGDINNPFWIGLNDVAVEGLYSWLSGEPVTFTNWRAGQPDDAPGLFGADFAVLTPPLGTWNDEPNDASTFVNLPRGVVELVSSDCDGNGLPDKFELLQDPSLDCDGNGVHDFCDLQDPALDCDGDGGLDSCQIAADPSLDCDGNGAIDSCEIVADVSLDCDANQFLDSCQIANDPSLDWNGDGLLDSCTGGSIVYCVSNENATGLRGLTQPLGSPAIADDAFSLRAYNLPIGQPGMFIMSRTTGLVNPFGGGAGVLCLGAPIRRFGPNDGFALQFSSAAGEIILSPPIGAFPGPNPVQPGEVLHFQLWHRENDPVTGAPRSNTSEGISVMFR
jgi:hypothetical protein